MSQRTTLETLAALTGLAHDIYVGEVQDNVRRKSICSMVFQDAPSGFLKHAGQRTVFAVDLRFKTGGVATDGTLPDYVGMDAVQGSITPVRRYIRIALDNLVELLASGEGAFEDLSERITSKMWDSAEAMEIRHAIGSSDGRVCLCASRTNDTTFVVKDGYGHTGTNPLVHLSEGSVIGWYDVSATAVGGAAIISSIAYDTSSSTGTIVIDSAATWEPGAQLAPDDIIYFATTNNITRDHFLLERGRAPNGLGLLVDPGAAYTTVHGIAEADYPRWKPFRQAATTPDHVELTEHWLTHGSKRGFPVSPATDLAITYPSVAAQIARSLMAFQQQAYTGENLRGGYNLGGASGNQEEYAPHAGLVVGGIPIYTDGAFYHNVLATISLDHLYRVPVGPEMGFWDGDGSKWARLTDFDGREAFVPDYMNYACTHRGANAAWTGITTDLDDGLFAMAVPNY